jgi:nitrite reductase (NADH) large subunit
MQRRLLVIGNGMSSLRLLEELVALAPHGFQITVVGAEASPAYNRVLLSPLLAGELAAADVELRPAAWYVENGITLRTGQPVVALDPVGRNAQLRDGERLAFDVCVLATGSEPILLPLPGSHLAGVTTFRSHDDIATMRAAAATGLPAVVIGGGLLGIEAAYGLARTGAKVTLVHLMDRLMERQLDAEAAHLLKRAMEAKGIRVLLRSSTRAILGGRRVRALELADGRTLPAALVVMAVGVKPSIRLAASAGLTTGRGIVVDDKLATSAAGIYALGECAEHRGQCYGLIEPAYEQARVLARHLAGRRERYEGSLLATSLKVSGVPVFSIGDFEGAGGEAVLFEDREAGIYRKLVLRGDRLCGAVLIGDTGEAVWYRELVRQQVSVAAIRGALAFGKAYAEAA